MQISATLLLDPAILIHARKSGLSPASVVLHLASNMLWDLPHAIIAVAALIALILKVDILWVVLVGATISVFIF
jgi:hypothetical protein